ncbi:chromosome segregation protein SMC [Thiomicrospira microaerophila]|uniref:chromosome segregation protein SMC n=1 Tax=Thiomicrospira microaerophila TaxID=406020 RepID=UPI00200CFB58|nr:chromosome segregation protein SMC [Thiomicrospira microaerophila]UQB41334.1 chromosome segregation protein SMC [Thiomicrospira microaerophila]
MRLKLIKIAGFKSFVEPTKLVLASELVGVVGPNGCGKSNTLDAVRWVMGESSARELRGGDMNDVLFNGSDKRKAVSQCSVELVFDNESGQASGAYASYSEISVKRVHHREEGTRYFLNQQPCRRRDIIDLFNGTGLGPRSYALIGQGNISRIIEAKPEDMRIYLEEVAGIGPYRSRRKETLIRLTRTRENLAQLNVLQEALNEQQNHLAIQAEKALDYRQARQRQQALEKTLYYLQWHRLHQQQTRTQSDLRLAERHFAESKAQWDQAQKAWLLLRQQQAGLVKELEACETGFHQLDKQVEKLEQQHLFSDKQSQQWLDQQTLNLQQTEMHQSQLTALRQQQDDLMLELEAIDEQRDQTQDQTEILLSRWEGLSSEKTKQEQALQQVQQLALQLEQRFKQVQQQLQSLTQTQTHLTEQRQLIEQHSASPQSDHQAERLLELGAQYQTANTSLLDCQQRLADLEQTIQQGRQNLNRLAESRDTILSQQAEYRAEYQALSRLQSSLVSNSETKDQPALADAQPLIEQLQVDDEWQLAVEAWLGARLQGVLLPSPRLWDSLQWPENWCLVGWNPPDFEVHPQSLAAQIQQPSLIRYLAAELFVRDESLSIEQQLVELDVLGYHQAWLIDKSGRLFSKYLCWPPLRSNLTGSLERQNRISFLDNEINNLDSKLKIAYEEFQQAKAAVLELEVELSSQLEKQYQQQRQLDKLTDQIEHAQGLQQALQKQQQASQQTLDVLIARQQKLEQQALDLDAELEAINAELEPLDDQEEALIQKLNQTLARLQPIEREREVILLQQQRLDQQYHQQQQLKQQVHFQLNQLQQQLKQDQLQADLIARHLSQTEPVDQQALASLREQRQKLEAERDGFKQVLLKLNSELEQAEQQAEQSQKWHHQSEQNLVTQQLQLQSVQQQIHQLQKTVESEGLSFYQLAQLRFDEQPLEQVEAELKQVKLHLSRLGAVNMTAIEEFEQVKIKLDELNRQLEDLVQSIDVLEQAIAHIDQDSRQRLLETFEQVNQGFKQLFPQLFRGGEAQLSWLDPSQDPLEGGLVVMARPPGKRNSRIQLLSGGEKTLSALALIFAIFELKPAPFCILDEVDAPLDDSNVIRFCGLVRSLSEKVQFIFITHNKTTMALAKHLVGVTMHEPGVSRLVSVDLDAAVEMIGD